MTRRRGIYNVPSRQEFRQQLRTHMTPAEALLWSNLKASNLGKKFRRQYGVGPYIVDFFCPESRVAIELDGEPHMDPLRREWDAMRQAYLAAQNIQIIRFENQTIFTNLEHVLEGIKAAINGKF